MKITKNILISLILFINSTGVWSATLVIENGNLKGADNIVFDGYTASVRFVEGTCASLFGGCDDGNDLIFDALTETQNDAFELGTAAVSAMQEQVFNAFPLYNDNPKTVFGCDDGGIQWCSIISPVHVIGTGEVATVNYQNQPAGLIDSISNASNSVESFNSGDWYYLTYASWTVTPVPLPAAGPMMLLGLAGLGLWGRTRKR